MKIIIKKIKKRIFGFVKKEYHKLLVFLLFFVFLQSISELPYFNTLLIYPTPKNLYVATFGFLFVLFNYNKQLLAVGFISVFCLLVFASLVQKSEFVTSIGNIFYYFLWIQLFFATRKG